jgi:hypothetical protein
MFAMVVQALTPMALAVDILAAANATPICHLPSGDAPKN